MDSKLVGDALFWIYNYVDVDDSCLDKQALDLKHRIVEAIIAVVPSDRE